MRYTLNYSPVIAKCVQPYNTIVQAGYYALNPDVSNNQIVVEDIKYSLTKIWFDCVKDPLNKRDLQISAIYFEHVEPKNDSPNSSSKMVYVKIPIIVDASNVGTYKHIRKFINQINECDMKSNSNVNIDINDTIYNATETSDPPAKTFGKRITNTFTFSNKVSSVNYVGYIVELAPMNVPAVCKFSVNDDAFDISIFTNTNVTTKTTPNNPHNNNVITPHTATTEGFSAGSDTRSNSPSLFESLRSFGDYVSRKVFPQPDVEGLTCKRKANTGVINGTVMSREFADKLIEAQRDIGIATIVMFFVSLAVITLGYLMSKSYEEIEVDINGVSMKPGLTGGGRKHGPTNVWEELFATLPLRSRRSSQTGGNGICDVNENEAMKGYAFNVMIALLIVYITGAIQVKEMSMMIVALVILACIIIYYVIITWVYHTTMPGASLENVILYNPQKPFIKWVAISSYYVWFKLFMDMVENREVTMKTFYITQALFILLALISGGLYYYGPDRIVNLDFTGAPIILILVVSLITDLILNLEERIRKGKEDIKPTL